MSWNYRVCKSTYTTENVSEVSFDIREVYYNKAGDITALTENAIGVVGEDIDAIKFVLEKMQLALSKDVVDLDTIIFAKYDIE
jgi:hypothetical protein